MPKLIALFIAVAAAFVSGNAFCQEEKQPPAANPNQSVLPATENTDAAPANPEGEDLRLVDDAVTKEAIDRLAGRRWRKLELSGSRVDASVLEALGDAASIRTLCLSNGRFSGQIPRLQNVKGLVELTLAGSLDGHDLDALGNLTQLECLQLPQDLTINVVGARELARLTKLKSLNFSGVNLDDAGLAELHTLVNLEKLDLTHTRVTDEGLKVLAHMPKLKSLELYRHPAWHIKQQISNDCLPVIGQLTELENLSLSGKINNAGLPQLARLRKLKSLSIHGSEITVEGFAALENLNIESLFLHASQLGSPDLANLKKLKSLKFIWVYGKFLPPEFQEKCHTAFPDIAWSWHS